MLSPIVVEFRSKKTTWDVYRSVHGASEISFFLDSVRLRRPDQSFSYIGADPFLEVTVQKKAGAGPRVVLRGAMDREEALPRLFPILRKLMKKYRSSSRFPFLTGGIVGFWSYEMAPAFEKTGFRPRTLPGIPWAHLGFYRDLIVYDHARRIYYLVTHADGTSKQARTHARAALGRLEARFADHGAAGGETFEMSGFRPEISRGRFERMVKKAKDYIRAGDIYQANLSQRFSFSWKGSPLALYGKLREINPSPFASFYKVRGLQIVSSSPERLVSKKGSLCETKPIAGTRPRPDAKEIRSRLRKELLANEKERAEHLMLVDLERNDLGRVSDWRSVRVRKMMAIEEYSHVMHIVSTITGRLKKGMDAFDLVRAMFPGGTITGCPKIRCMQIIDELEKSGRGLYTGSLGYIGFSGDMDLNILIRTLVLKGRKGSFQVGAGIVHDSDPGREYEETLHKGEALALALAQASTGDRLEVRGRPRAGKTGRRGQALQCLSPG